MQLEKSLPGCVGSVSGCIKVCPTARQAAYAALALLKRQAAGWAGMTVAGGASDPLAALSCRQQQWQHELQACRGADLKGAVAQGIHKGQLVGEAQVVALPLEGGVRLLGYNQDEVPRPLPRTLLPACTYTLDLSLQRDALNYSELLCQLVHHACCSARLGDLTSVRPLQCTLLGCTCRPGCLRLNYVATGLLPAIPATTSIRCKPCWGQ